VLGEVPHHRVERAPLDGHVLVLAAGAQLGRDLVRVHRLLDEDGEDGERKQVADPATSGHPARPYPSANTRHD
jgi:hypothetical protein